MDTQLDVLVVGAGPVGLFLARELVRHGLRVRLVEKQLQQSQHSKALAIMPRTLEVFEIAGIAAPFAAAANHVTRATVMDRGRVLGAIPFTPEGSHYPYTAMIAQDVTEAILVEQLQTVGGRVEYGTELVGLDQGAGGVRASFRDASVCTARFVVGCDGAHSTVRHLLGLPFAGAEYPETFILADLETSPAWRGDEMQLCPSPAGAIACFPMSSVRRRIVAMVDPDYSGEPDLAFMQNLLLERGLGALQPTRVFWSSSFRIHHRETSRMRQGAIFLAGDAAHIHSPFGAQGMNTGLQDAWNLAWKLRFVLAGWAGDELLDSYSTERHAVAHQVLRGTHALTRIMGERRRWFCAARNLAVRVLTRTPTFRAQFVSRLSELGVHYAHSRIVRGSGARAGDEPCLDAGTSAEVPLFSALGRQYLLVLPAQLARAEFGALLAEYPAQLTVLHAKRSGARVRLVRPDGYVAYEAGMHESAAQAAAAIERLLSGHVYAERESQRRAA